METIKRSALVPYSAMQMFQLVDDVASYPQFVPHCKGARIISRDGDTLVAELEVAQSGMVKTFATRNTSVPGESIDMHLENGPFKTLRGGWQFTPLSGQACKIELNLEFEFSNRLASLAFAGIFSHLLQSMVSAFTQRAEQIYGKQ